MTVKHICIKVVLNVTLIKVTHWRIQAEEEANQSSLLINLV